MVGNTARRLAVGALAAVVAGALTAPAFAHPGRSFGLRSAAARGGFAPFAGPGGGRFFGGGIGGGLGGPGGPFPVRGGGPGGPGGGGALAIDVLTPAASFLGISADTLASDLKSGKTLAQEAIAKGKTAADLISAVVASEKKVFDAEVTAGWITTAQETALVDQVTNEVTSLVNSGPPIVSTQAHQGLLQLAATFLGVSLSDLQSDLKSGKTLAQEAQAKGKAVADLVTALEAPAKTQLDGQVTAGTITQAQENTVLANLTTRLTDFVNGTSPQTTANAAIRNAVAKYALAKYMLRFGLHR